MFGLSSIRLYVFLGMALATVLLGATTAVLWSRLDAKEAAIASLTQQRDLAAADAARWQGAAAERAGVIERQAQSLRRLESDGQAARAIAASHADQAAQRIAVLEAKISHLKEAAHARPDDVRLLGPIVRDALPSLQQ
ncbi:hypothetical protein DLREEDagr8_22700 [Dongia sp. agr-C8]